MFICAIHALEAHIVKQRCIREVLIKQLLHVKRGFPKYTLFSPWPTNYPFAQAHHLNTLSFVASCILSHHLCLNYHVWFHCIASIIGTSCKEWSIKIIK